MPFDIDVLRYEAPTSTSGAAITVGTWRWRSRFVAYRRRSEAHPDEHAGEGEIEYCLPRRFVLGYNWRTRWLVWPSEATGLAGGGGDLSDRARGLARSVQFLAAREL